MIDACDRAAEDFTAGLDLVECLRQLRDALLDAEELQEPDVPRS